MENAISASMAVLAACPDGKEWGSVLRYMAPHFPSGRWRLTENLTARTNTARTTDPAAMSADIWCHKPSVSSQMMNNPKRMNQESPEWAMKAPNGLSLLGSLMRSLEVNS